MGVNSIPVGSPRVRPMGVHRTCGEPNEIKKHTHPHHTTARFPASRTSPLFTSVGTIMVIPLSNLVDYLAKDAVLPAKVLPGRCHRSLRSANHPRLVAQTYSADTHLHRHLDRHTGTQTHRHTDTRAPAQTQTHAHARARTHAHARADRCVCPCPCPCPCPGPGPLPQPHGPGHYEHGSVR